MRRIAGIVNNLTYQRGEPNGFVPSNNEPKLGTAEVREMKATTRYLERFRATETCLALGHDYHEITNILNQVMQHVR